MKIRIAQEENKEVVPIHCYWRTWEEWQKSAKMKKVKLKKK